MELRKHLVTDWTRSAAIILGNPTLLSKQHAKTAFCGLLLHFQIRTRNGGCGHQQLERFINLALTADPVPDPLCPFISPGLPDLGLLLGPLTFSPSLSSLFTPQPELSFETQIHPVTLLLHVLSAALTVPRPDSKS